MVIFVKTWGSMGERIVWAGKGVTRRWVWDLGKVGHLREDKYVWEGQWREQFLVWEGRMKGK